MEVSIDISIFAMPSSAVGHVSGNIELPVLPRVGETMSFMFSDKQQPFPTESGFDGLLKVEDVIFSVGADLPPSLALESINANSIECAMRIGAYFEAAFGLYFNPYSN